MHLVFTMDVPSFERRAFEAAAEKLGWAQLRELKLYQLIYDRANHQQAVSLLAPMVRTNLGHLDLGMWPLRKALGLESIPQHQVARTVGNLSPLQCGRPDFPANVVLVGTREDNRTQRGPEGARYWIDNL